MGGSRRGWTWLELRRQQWTGNSGRPLCECQLDLANLGLGRGVGGTQRDPAIAVLLRSVALDVPLCVEVDEAHTVIVAGDAGVGRQNGVLAVRAEHFGRCRCLATIGHCPDVGQFVLHPKLSLEVC